MRAKIIAAAARLIAEGGPNAATTRAVASAAGVQAPTIYRLFGDKQGLLGAAVESVLSNYVATKAGRVADADPLQDLRNGWDMHVAFGLEHPHVFAITVTSGLEETVYRTGLDVLRKRVQRLAEEGLLTFSVDRAVALFQAAGMGTVLTLLQQPEDERDPGLSVAAREAIIASFTREASKRGDDGLVRAAATTLSARLSQTSALSKGERLLLQELLTRIANAQAVPGIDF